MKQQLVGLERRTARGGKDSIDHPPGGHDDVANAAAGAIVMALKKGPGVPGLSNRRSYQFDEADIRKIFKALKEAIADTERKFDPSNRPTQTSFKL
jgi:hypothetical protein